MKISGLIGLALIVLFVGSCKEDQDHEGSLTLHFIAFYDGQPLTMFVTKPFTNPQQLQFTHLSFLVSDLVLLDQLSIVDLKDIELIDLSFDDVNGADQGYTIQINNLPAQSYTGIRFGIGVPPDLNSKKPANFASSHPLSKTSYYWEAWNSFIFMKTEGRIDTLGNGGFDTGFAFHTGTNKLFSAFEKVIPITIEEGKNKGINIRIDYKTVLNGIDIKAKPQNHNPADSVQIGKLVENLSGALSLTQ